MKLLLKLQKFPLVLAAVVALFSPQKSEGALVDTYMEFRATGFYPEGMTAINSYIFITDSSDMVQYYSIGLRYRGGPPLGYYPISPDSRWGIISDYSDGANSGVIVGVNLATADSHIGNTFDQNFFIQEDLILDELRFSNPISMRYSYLINDFIQNLFWQDSLSPIEEDNKLVAYSQGKDWGTASLSPVPEPSAVLLSGLGMLGMVVRRRR